jgi:hypothetical protein
MSEVSDDFEIGPVDWILVEFSGPPTGIAAPYLLDLVDRGLIRILDLVLVHKAADGEITLMEMTDIDGDGELDLVVFDGVRSGLLGEEDAAEAATAMEADTSAVLLLYENSWAAPFATAMRRAGGQLVASGRIPFESIVASLDALEAADASSGGS